MRIPLFNENKKTTGWRNFGQTGRDGRVAYQSTANRGRRLAAGASWGGGLVDVLVSVVWCT